MPVRQIVKSENYWASVAAGGATQWLHIDGGFTGRTTIKATTKSGSRLILCNVVVNTAGSGGGTVVRDSGVGVIANIKASVAEKDFHYNINLTGDLQIDNPGGQDLTIIYVNY